SREVDVESSGASSLSIESRADHEHGQKPEESVAHFHCPFHRATHGVGFQPEASFSFLKCVVVHIGWDRYSGSLISDVTRTMESPPGTSKRSKYSVSVVLALYGTPFFRRYPGFIFVVTTFNDPPGMGPRAPATTSHSAIETPCQSPPL